MYIPSVVYLTMNIYTHKKKKETDQSDHASKHRDPSEASQVYMYA